MPNPTLTAAQRADNKATHYLPPDGGICLRCGMAQGSPSIRSQVEEDPCPTFVNYVLRLLLEVRPYIARPAKQYEQAEDTLLHKIDAALRAQPVYQDDAFAIFYEDLDCKPEFFIGHGAAAAAWKRWYMLQDQWSCNLYRRVAGPHRSNLRELPVGPL